MALQCPYCRQGLSLKDAKPGRYKPKCSKCGERFALTIFPDANQAPLSERLPSVGANTTVAADATIAASSSATHPAGTTIAGETVAGATKAAATVHAVSADATLAFAPTVPAAGSGDPRRTSGADQTLAANEATIAATSDSSASVGTQATRATVPAEPNEKPVANHDAGPMPDRIGGYRVVKELGRGAMGAVYLARQLSLDRDVALKTIQAQWANHPTFIARFTREAYAAAQLTHHNVVQIYDLGVERGTNYFSMEFVRGRSLDDVLREQQHLAPELAVGYIVQAARGLQFAHANGMVHRDVKPANMMLNEHGVVKIADLGLVKVATAGFATDEPRLAAAGPPEDSLAVAKSDVTLANVAMGTPAYMAPEQADNAAGVDHRADIYSLGCSLYVLLTGKPPFEGKTAIEVITKHRTAPIVSPDVLVKGLPKQLADITMKMVAKQPAERYQSLTEVIADLERYLGGSSDAPSGPSEAQAAELERAARAFASAGLAKLRGPIAAAFVVAGLALAAILFMVSLAWSSALVALVANTLGSYFVVSGSRERTVLFDKTRATVLTARWTDWLTWLGGGLLAVLMLWLIGWLVAWIAAIVVGSALGATGYFLIDQRLKEQRRGALEQAKSVLRALRVRGTDETAVQQFVARFSGDPWEEFFEALFGFDAKLAARQQLAQGDGRARAKFREWREPIIRWLDARLRADREERERVHLQRVEEQCLRAQGLDPKEAEQQAGRIAAALVDQAAEARVVSIHNAPTVADPAQAAQQKRERIKKMLADAKSGAYQSKRNRLAETALAPVAFLLSGKLRFVVGCLLIAGCVLWAKQNNLVSGEQLKAATAAAKSMKAGEVKLLTHAASSQKAEPLAVPIVGRFFDSWYPGISGVMLIGLSLFSGWRMSLFALPAAALIVFGPVFGPPSILLVAGLGVGGVGLFFGREKS